MVTDGSKEQTLGDFWQKLWEVDCHLRVTKPYSPWQQAAEGCIRKIKWGSLRKMISTSSPKPLWDHSLRSCTCNDIYMTAGQVRETIMTGSTGWYDWVMYQDNIASYPDDKLILGRYLGPATHIGSALTAKILQPNGSCDISPTRSFKALFTLTNNTSSMSLSQLILDRLQQFRISLPKTWPQTLTTSLTSISLTLIMVMPRSRPKWVTITSALRSCLLVVAQWSKDVLPRVSATGMATQMGLPIPTLS
jgi:hypothetical protein